MNSLAAPMKPAVESNEGIDVWLSHYIRVDREELVTDHPWGRTICLWSDAERFFLKVLPVEQRAALQAMPLLSEIFPSNVPSVVAVDPAQGFLLLREHGGEDLDRSFDDELACHVLCTYARMQAIAARQPELLVRLPGVELATSVTEFMEFLSPRGQLTGNVGAAHFLDEGRAQYYFQRLSLRRELLEKLLDDAANLPVTLNHCDLRYRNVALAADGSPILFDWDEAASGPAGMSLHNFFSGCSAIAEILLGNPAAKEVEQEGLKAALLQVYIRALVDLSYADEESLRCGLPGAVCAGVMRYLISYGKFPTDDADDRDAVARILVRRLDDLLSLCDLLSARHRDTAIRACEDYESSDGLDRAQEVLQAYLAAQPNDAELRGRWAAMMRESGDAQAAVEACRRGLAVNPIDSALRRELGCALVDLLELDEAVDQLQIAAALAPADAEAAQWLEDARAFHEAWQSAGRPGYVPTVRFPASDRQHQAAARARLRLAARLFREYGTLVIENAYRPQYLDELATEFLRRHEKELQGDGPEDALQVGNRRFMVSVEIQGPFNSPELYAASNVAGVVRRVLEDDYVMGSFTAVASLPGARDMRMHKDHPALFPEDGGSLRLPHFAVTVLVPLRGFDPLMGTTRVVKRSHRHSSSESAEMETQDPLAPKGSCLLMDYRLSHQGLANRSEQVRPVLSLVYNRPWFRDIANYGKQEPILMSDDAFGRVPDEHRHLFAWAKTRFTS